MRVRVDLKLILSLASVFLIHLSSAQTYSIKQKFTNDHFEVRPLNQGLYCLFRISEKKASTTIFRKVFLNEELKGTDSSTYSIEGKAALLTSYADDQFFVHAFYTKTNSVEKIVFLVCDHAGNIQNSFFKTANEFSRYFSKPIKKLKNLRISFAPNTKSPGMLLMQSYQLYDAYSDFGKLTALNATDGKELWISNSPFFNLIQTTEHLIIGLCLKASANGFNPNDVQQIFFVDKETGQTVKTISMDSPGKRHREVSVFTTNGIDLMVAGSEFEGANTKNGKFFMTMFNLSGEPIFDRVDSAARLSTRRMHLMGSVFDPDGNLVLVAEGWKPDATRMVATTAGTIALAILTRGAYTRVYSTGIDHKIDQLIFATLSSEDGSIKNFKSFPVGPWLSYGRLLTVGSRIILVVAGQVLTYDAGEASAAPALFTTLHPGENFILTSFGPIKSKRTNRLFTLSRFR